MPRNAPGLIGVDWGTSSFRAYRLGPEGKVLDQVLCSYMAFIRFHSHKVSKSDTLFKQKGISHEGSYSPFLLHY